MTPRVLVALVAGVLLVGCRQPGPAPADPASSPSPASVPTSPVAVLGAWDARRVAAWREGDPRALRALYVPGSESGRADRLLLREYAARGLRVPDLAVQRAAVRVVAEQPDRLVLVVTDRVVVPAAVTSRARPVALPRDTWSTRRVVLRLVDDAWRVVEVRDRGGPARTTRPR